MKRANRLAIELKSWSLNLSIDLDLTNILKKFKFQIKNDNSLLMLIHMSQFYGIMLLCRPFLMYVLVRKLKPETRSELQVVAKLEDIRARYLFIDFSTHFVVNDDIINI